MNLAGVSTLFINPKLRSSNYLQLLAEALPTFASSPVSTDPALPSLQNLVVVDNIPTNGIFQEELKRIPRAIDFRDIFVWREDGAIAGQVQKLSNSLGSDDIINLQFTRHVAFTIQLPADQSLDCQFITVGLPVFPRPSR